MTRKNPAAKWPLPDDVYPSGVKCYGMQVPDQPQYLAAWRGAIQGLGHAYNWGDDEAHTAAEVALLWRDFVDEAREIPCATLREPSWFLRQNDNDPELTTVTLYDVTDERDISYKNRAWAAYANPFEPVSPLHMSFDFEQYEGALKVGVRLHNMFIHAAPCGGDPGIKLHWWDCSDVEHEETSDSPHIFKADWPVVTQIGVVKFWIEAFNPISLFITGRSLAECVAP